jgi:hypothetical protein
MKYAAIAALAVTSGSAQQLISDAPSDLERHYMNYLSRHNKSYATREEYEFRFA